MSPITTVIFDMFNTLVKDGEDFWVASFQRVIDHQQLDVTATALRKEWSSGDNAFRARRIAADTAFQSYREAWEASFRRTFAALGLNGDSAEAVDLLIGDMGQRPLHEDTLAALDALQDKYRLAVLSNVDECVLGVCLSRINHTFEAALSSEAARCYKPRPELFRDMLGRLDLRPEQAVYVGDKQYEDVQGARNTGLHSFWINRDGTSSDHNLPEPDYRAQSLLELPDWLSGQSQSSGTV